MEDDAKLSKTDAFEGVSLSDLSLGKLSFLNYITRPSVNSYHAVNLMFES